MQLIRERFSFRFENVFEAYSRIPYRREKIFKIGRKDPRRKPFLIQNSRFLVIKSGSLFSLLKAARPVHPLNLDLDLDLDLDLFRKRFIETIWYKMFRD